MSSEFYYGWWYIKSTIIISSVIKKCAEPTKFDVSFPFTLLTRKIDQEILLNKK